MNDTQNSHTLELLEERAVVHKDSYVAGTIRLQKVARTRTVQVPVELTEHYLIIDSTPNDNAAPNDTPINHQDHTQEPMVLINGTPLALGQSQEILLGFETATIKKQTVIKEQVNISKTLNVREETLITELAHEELVVQDDLPR